VFKLIYENGNTIKSKPYKFFITETIQKVDIETIELIRIENNRLNIVLYIKNNQEEEVYLTGIDLDFLNSSNKAISNNFERVESFIPEILNPSEEKKVTLKYSTSSEAEDVYVNISINGKTEGVLDSTCFTTKKTLTNVINESEISIVANAKMDQFLENDKMEYSYLINGIKRGKVLITYGNVEIEEEFEEGLEGSVDFFADIDYNEIRIEILELNITEISLIEVKKIEEITIEYEMDNYIYVGKEFNLLLDIPEYLKKELLEIRVPESYDVEKIQNENYKIFTESEDKAKIYVYYNGSEIEEIDVSPQKDRKIKLESLNYSDKNGIVTVEFDMYVNDNLLYRYVDIEFNSVYQLKSFESIGYELLSKQIGRVRVKIELIKSGEELLDLSLKYKEIETSSEIEVKIF